MLLAIIKCVATIFNASRSSSRHSCSPGRLPAPAAPSIVLHVADRVECLILQPESLIVVGHLAGRKWQYLLRRCLRQAQVRGEVETTSAEVGPEIRIRNI
jgi:hypothetical protein